MVLLTDEYYNAVKDYLHPNIHKFVNHYRRGNFIDFPHYHGSDKFNRNGTRKFIKYKIGEHCVASTNRPCWKITKNKYEHGPTNGKRQYWKRYMTWTNQRFLFKNKGNFVYNYQLKKFEHMSEMPMLYEHKYLQRIRKKSLKNVLK